MTRRAPKLETLAAFKRLLRRVKDADLGQFRFIHNLLLGWYAQRRQTRLVAAMKRRIRLIDKRLREAKEQG